MRKGIDLAAEVVAVAADREVRKASARMRALDLVSNGAIEWRTDVGVEGGFVRAAPTPGVPNIDLLIALWELRHHHLIAVDGHRVCVTLAAADLVSPADRLRSERVGSGGRG